MSAAFWLSWSYVGPFTWEGPWWVSGQEFGHSSFDEYERPLSIFCAAVMADDVEDACERIIAAHDGSPRTIVFRFCTQKPEGWTPFCDRFRRAKWMKWPWPRAPEAA